MAIQQINNLELGYDVRSKLNEVVSRVNSLHGLSPFMQSAEPIDLGQIGDATVEPDRHQHRVYHADATESGYLTISPTDRDGYSVALVLLNNPGNVGSPIIQPAPGSLMNTPRWAMGKELILQPGPGQTFGLYVQTVKSDILLTAMSWMVPS